LITIDTNPYKSIIVDSEGKLVTIREGDKIKFCLESGLVKRGTVTKLQGKEDKLKIQMMPKEKECEEIWSVMVMVDGSLKLDDEE